MKTFIFAALSLSLLTTGLHDPLFAQDAPQKKADKQVPTPGRFEIHVTAGDREKSFEQPQAADPMPKGQSKAARVAEVRRRIQIALRKQMTGGRPGRPPKRLNPLMVRKTIQKEIEKARQEGLLPSDANPGNAGGGFAAGNPREARKEAIIQALALTLGQADSVGKVEPETTDQVEDNPKTEDTPKTEDNSKTKDNPKPNDENDEDEKPAEEKPDETETSNDNANQ